MEPVKSSCEEFDDYIRRRYIVPRYSTFSHQTNLRFDPPAKMQ